MGDECCQHSEGHGAGHGEGHGAGHDGGHGAGHGGGHGGGHGVHDDTNDHELQGLRARVNTRTHVRAVKDHEKDDLGAARLRYALRLCETRLSALDALSNGNALPPSPWAKRKAGQKSPKRRKRRDPDNNVYSARYKDAGVNKGVIAQAASFSGMAEAARVDSAKGVVWERGEHPLGGKLWEQWVREQQETAGHFTREKLRVGAPRGEDGESPPKKIKPDPAVAGLGEIRAACKRLAAPFPRQLRDAIRDDAEALAAMVTRLCPDAPNLTLATEVIGGTWSCGRWHQDRYVGRAIITYTGPGTWAVDDKEVRYAQFKATVGMPHDVSGPAIVPDYNRICRSSTNSVMLIKGDSWPGIRGVGVTHKSPDVPLDEAGNPELLRLVLKVDLHNDRG